MSKRPSRVIQWLLVGTAFCTPLIVLSLAWKLSDSTKILPGLRGCQYIRQRNPQITCYRREFERLRNEKGLHKTFKIVDQAAQHYQTLGADCHLAWHPLGESDGRNDVKNHHEYKNIAAKTTCQQGFAHGYTIGYLSTGSLTAEEIGQIMIKQCSSESEDIQTFNCTHAFGHAIARKVPNNAHQAAAICESADYEKLHGAGVPVPGGVNTVVIGAEHQCLYGMYMEIGIYDVSHGDTVLNNCVSAESTAAKKACYAYLPGRIGSISGGLKQAAKSCHTMVPVGDFRDSCIKTFSFGLLNENDCILLTTKIERAQCHDVFRDRADNLAGNTENIDLDAVGPGPTKGPPDLQAPPQ